MYKNYFATLNSGRPKTAAAPDQMVRLVRPLAALVYTHKISNILWNGASYVDNIDLFV